MNNSFPTRYFVFILFAIAFINCQQLSAQPIRPANQHPNPFPLSNIKASHPRLWFNSENLTLLKNRWNDPKFKDIVDPYKSGTDAISYGIKYLATNNPSDAQNAISIALNSNGDRVRKAAWSDISSLIFDWCYNQLSSDQKNNLLNKIKTTKQNLKKQLLDKFRFHENHLLGMHAYITAVLAIEGEAGVNSELRDAQNILQNLCEMADEISGDGG